VCDAPDEETATAIEEEMITFFEFSIRGHLMPPWSKTPPLTAAQIAARRTYGRIEKLRRDFQAERDRANPLAPHTGTSAEAKEARRAAVSRRYYEASSFALEQVRRQPSQTVDSRIVALYEASHRPAGEIGYVELGSKVAEFMGHVPLENGKPKRGAQPTHPGNGEVGRKGRHLRIHLIRGDTQDGFAAFAEWLIARGCSDLKYRILLYGSREFAKAIESGN
jgi:hypothetical protein